MNYATPFQALVKRPVDIVGGLIGCVLAGIIILIVSPQIKELRRGRSSIRRSRIGAERAAIPNSIKSACIWTRTSTKGFDEEENAFRTA